MNGQYAHNIDAKGRLFIPTKLRDELGGTLHVTIGQDHCLSVYSDEGWARFNESLKGKSFTEIKRLRMMYAYIDRLCPRCPGPHSPARQAAAVCQPGKRGGHHRHLRPGRDLERRSLAKNGGRGLQLR